MSDNKILIIFIVDENDRRKTDRRSRWNNVFEEKLSPDLSFWFNCFLVSLACLRLWHYDYNCFYFSFWLFTASVMRKWQSQNVIWIRTDDPKENYSKEEIDERSRVNRKLCNSIGSRRKKEFNFATKRSSVWSVFLLHGKLKKNGLKLSAHAHQSRNGTDELDQTRRKIFAYVL